MVFLLVFIIELGITNGNMLSDDGNFIVTIFCVDCANIIC
jgi:hypothetical protein